MSAIGFRIAVAATAAAAFIPIANPAKARVQLTFCERLGVEYCESASDGSGSVGFWACVEQYVQDNCTPPDPPFPLNPIPSLPPSPNPGPDDPNQP